MRYRIIPPLWLKSQGAHSYEGEYSELEALELNAEGYGIFTHPNTSSQTHPRGKFLTAKDIDTFQWVFVDIDFKHGVYPDVDSVLARLSTFELSPTKVISTGHGVHAYWRVSDLTAKSFLHLGFRLCRFFDTDSAVVKLEQVMRVPDTLNTKNNDEDWPVCTTLSSTEVIYTCADLHKALPPISAADEAKALAQCARASGEPLEASNELLPLPQRFLTLLKSNLELKDLFQNKQDDRSLADFDIGRILLAYGFSKAEAMSVLARTYKAAERTPEHQTSYARNIVDKLWVDAPASKEPRYTSMFSGQISWSPESLGTRIVCHPAVDATSDGFRRGQVLGLIGGTGNGKSTFALNMTRWFAENNVKYNYIYLYVLLESTKEKLSRKWEKMVAELRQERPDVNWDEMLCVLSNHGDDGEYRDLGMDDIKEHVTWLEATTGRKVGVIIIDHIGKVRQARSSKSGEYDGLIGVCKQLNPLAISTDTFVIVQSQTSRSKGEQGDVELNVDAAFGVSSFEWHVDHLMVVWQPLRRVYAKMPPDDKLCVTLYKFCKARERDVLRDKVQLDVPYGLRYDPNTEVFRMLTPEEETAFKFWNTKAIIARNQSLDHTAADLTSVTWV